MTIENLNRFFDHTNLKPEATTSDIKQLCDEAIKYRFYSIVVNPVWIKTAKENLDNHDIRITSVTGFPLGANLTEIKISEAVNAVRDGADEIDMVANIGELISNNNSTVEKEIDQIRQSLPYNVILKVIIEAGKLSEQQMINTVRSVINGGAQFVKTSTGFFGKSTPQQVKTLVSASENKIEVKAAGGIRALSDCESMIQAGATRIGCSASVAIMREWFDSK